MVSNGQEVLQRLREQLAARGAKTIASIGRVFRNLDSYDGNRKIDADELFYGMQELGVQLTKAESQAVLSIMDTDGSGNINLDEFLVGIRGSLNETRQAMVDKAYNKFDSDGSGFVDSNDLRGVYSAAQHPKVISGEMTEDEVFMDFLAAFGDKNGDGRIDKAEWNEYYSAVSSNIDNDEYFCVMMTNAWKL